ncbi:MAG: beta-galactosidase [Deltaproteobacteria bacterium]|nr:beta-galactosidase [Deltaproteobacteria bacterium]
MSRKNKILLVSILVMVGVFILCLGEIPPALAADEDESILGVTIRSEWGDPNTHSLVVDAGVRWVRTSVSWAAHEPVQGQKDLSGLDRLFKSFTDIGLKPVVYIADNPSWAASSKCGPIDKVSLQALADFVGVLAERYDGDGDYDGDGVVDGPALPRIDYWALYNEPDNQWTSGEASAFDGCWGRDGKSYAQLMGLVKQAVQKANPNAQVVFSSVAGEKVACPSTWGCAGQDIFNFNIAGGDFVDDVLGYIQSHPGDYFDIFDFHYYPAFQWQWASWGNGILGKARYYQNRLQSHGLSKPMIVTETGKKSDGTGGDEAQTNHLVMTYIRAMAAGLKSVMWFTFTDIYDGVWAGWGLLEFGLVGGFWTEIMRQSRPILFIKY